MSRPRRRRSTAGTASRPAVLDWSTSYMASASSSHSQGALGFTEGDSSTYDESAEEEPIHSQPPAPSTEGPGNLRIARSISPAVFRRPAERGNVANVAESNEPPPSSTHFRTSPSIRHSHHRIIINLLPKYLMLNSSIPRFGVQVDIRKLLEHLILFSAAMLALVKFYRLPNALNEMWAVRELGALTVASLLYLIATRNAIPPLPPLAHSPAEGIHRRQTSPFLAKEAVSKQSLLWKTTSKDYRSDADDGVLTALLLGPVTTASMLYGSLIVSLPEDTFYPRGWRVESPRQLQNSTHPMAPKEALLSSRRNLLQLSTLCAFVLLTHLCTSRLAPLPPPTTHHHGAQEEERHAHSIRRSRVFIGYSALITTVAVVFHVACDLLGVEIWKDLSYFDVAVISSFYQLAIYVMIRLSHGGFTLGEVGLVSIGSTVLFMETVNLTLANLWPKSIDFIKTTRYPTPLLVYQLALIPGSLLVGFLLSPLLVLSRHTSKIPAHRLKRQNERRIKRPLEREIQRRALAISFYLFSCLLILGPIGFWTQASLGGRNPWVWIVYWLLEGRRTWSRPALLVYWAALGSFSVAAWGRQLARSRKFQSGSISMSGMGRSVDVNHVPELPPMPPTPTTNGFAHVATDILDAADKRVPTLSLNSRRKSFHAVALLMFFPGIVLDPAFTHVCFSAAFALFVFAEYIRYFALYPFGRFVHIFLHEFVDSKDSGSAVLSHFYLLTGFANCVWLEGPWRLLEFTGALSLGVGDSMASIVGRKMGRTRWTEGNPKTVEGSVAFLVSVLFCSLSLRTLGVVEPFSIPRYVLVLAAGCLLEAVSNQNDNLTIPVFLWSITVLFGVVKTST